MKIKDSTADDVAQALGVENTASFRLRFTFQSICRFVFERLAWMCPHESGRRFFYKLMGVKIGVGGYLGTHIVFDKSFPESIHIGDHVLIGDRCTFYAHVNNNRPDNELKKFHPIVLKPVVVEDHCWLMPNASVLPGVTVGHHSVIGNSCVIARKVPPNSTVIPNPPIVMPSMRKNSQTEKDKSPG